MQTDWSKFFAPGPEILEYLEGVVEKYQLMPHIKLQHRVTRAKYNEANGKWHLTILRPRKVKPDAFTWDWTTDCEEFEDTADVLFTGVGGLSRWSWPDIEGIENFNGSLIHSAQWVTGEGEMQHGWEDTVKSWGDKRVGIIGVVRASFLYCNPELRFAGP